MKYEFEKYIIKNNLTCEDIMNIDCNKLECAKDFSMYVFDPIIPKLVKTNSNHSEIYISNNRFQELKNSILFNLMNIKESHILTELPFDKEKEKESCERIGVDHGQYNRDFMNNINDRTGLLFTPELEHLILNDPYYIIYTMTDY